MRHRSAAGAVADALALCFDSWDEDGKSGRRIRRAIPSLSHAVANAIRLGEKKAAKPRAQGLTRDSRATVEQVLDNRTLQFLDKLRKWRAFDQLFGCISTGKEANVYLAHLYLGDDVTVERAVKVFKTSILVFRDRAKYVDGEMRFRRGYVGNSNPRKMVRQWAEKEHRNLLRLGMAGLRVPRAIELRGHVLAMAFLGHGGRAAPRLQDVGRRGDVALWRRLYIETLCIMRNCFQKARLVHSDFSEFNLLLHQGHVYVIDVSQSVERDHPRAMEFLKRDCESIRRFFVPLVGCVQQTEGTADAEIVQQGEEDFEDEEEDDAEVPGSKWIEYLLEEEQLRNYMEQQEEILGDLAAEAFRPLTIQEAFQYVINNDFLNSSTSADNITCWPEFDVGERKRSAGEATVTEKPQPQPRKRKRIEFTPVPRTVQRYPNEEELATARREFGLECARTLEMIRACSRDSIQNSEGEKHEEIGDRAFVHSWMPKSLHEFDGGKSNENDCVDERALAFLSSKADQKDESGNDDNEDDNENSVKWDEEEEVSTDDTLVQFTGVIPEGVGRKAWKKFVKEQNRDKRTRKIPKKVKKRAAMKSKKKR